MPVRNSDAVVSSWARSPDVSAAPAWADWAKHRSSSAFRDDMRIRTGAGCFCSQTRGSKIGLISHFGPQSDGLKATFR